MKKILFAAVSALAMSAAIAADSTQFGVLKVPSTAAQTIVAVPWLESGTGSDSVTVSNLVLTSGLNNGDTIKLFENGAYTKTWVLQNGAWTGGNVVSGNNDVKQSGNDQTTIARGKAIMLTRTGNDLSKGFYIMGKPATSGVGPMTLPAGSSEKPVYALVAPPTTSAADINKANTWTGLTTAMDRLIINRNGASEILTWTGECWGSKTHPTGGEITIPEGQGAWFISYGPGTKTVTW